MKKILLFLLTVTLTLSFVGCNFNFNFKKDTPPPVSSGEEEDQHPNGGPYYDFIYDEENGLTLDCYVAPREVCNGGVIVFLHGNAWVDGSKNDEYIKPLWDKYLNSGFTVASVNCRSASEDADAECMLGDIENALNCISNLVSENYMSAENAMLIGWSSGGHLAELYSYRRAENALLKVKCVCAYGGISDFCDKNFYTKNPLDETLEQPLTTIVSNLCNTKVDTKDFKSCTDALAGISPVTFVASSVPTIICHGEKDKVVNYKTAVSLSEALQNAGTRVELVPFPTSDHDLASDPVSLETSYSLIDSFANEYLIVK